MLAWTAPGFGAVKGIVHAPSAKPELKLESRDALLIAIVQARGWIDDIAAIIDGTAPVDLTVTDLAKALPYSWAEQEQSIGLLQ